MGESRTGKGRKADTYLHVAGRRNLSTDMTHRARLPRLSCPVQPIRYAQNEALFQQMRASGAMPKPPPPHYYSAGNYGGRNVGPGVGGPPVVMLPSYVAHQQGMGQQNAQGSAGQQGPPPPGVAQRFLEQPQRHDGSPSLTGASLDPPPLPHDYKRQAATGPKGVPVRAPAPYAPSAAPAAHSSKPPRGPLPMKDPGFARDQKRHPTLGQVGHTHLFRNEAISHLIRRAGSLPVLYCQDVRLQAWLA